MRRFLLLVIVLLPIVCIAQENLKKIRTSSWQTQAYRVSAADVEMFIKWDSIPVIRYVNVKPCMTFFENYIDETTLGTGNFILISAVDNKISAELISNSDLVLLTINNKDKLQLDVRNKKGEFMENAHVFVNDKEVHFNKDSKTYWVKQNELDEASVKIYAAADTFYKTLSLKEEISNSVENKRGEILNLVKSIKF